MITEFNLYELFLVNKMLTTCLLFSGSIICLGVLRNILQVLLNQKKKWLRQFRSNLTKVVTFLSCKSPILTHFYRFLMPFINIAKKLHIFVHRSRNNIFRILLISHLLGLLCEHLLQLRFLFCCTIASFVLEIWY